MTRSVDNAPPMEVVLPSSNVSADLAFFTERLGFVLDTIFPADDPRLAVLSGHGVRLRLDRGARVAPGILRLPCLRPEEIAAGAKELVAPNGVRIEIVEAVPPVAAPATQHALVVRRRADGDAWVVGRAGMLYRDLIPGRLGGAAIASHIRIPDPGPVPDLVHFHDVAFQLIFCAHGWVRVVYEDQGPPFVLNEGDCLIQPPRIRHRVLEASANLEVVELTAPAEHLTTMDHTLALPNSSLDPGRLFSGQRFCKSEAEKAEWGPWRFPGFEARDTGLSEASGGVGSVKVVRPVGARSRGWARHTADILFGFVWKGTLTFVAEDETTHVLTAGDSFVVPPGWNTAFTDVSKDLQLLEVSLPASFETIEETAPPL